MSAARWDAFLGKLEGRFDELMAEAREGCAALLDVAGLDPLPMTNAWTGVRAQVHDLVRKISDTWSAKVEADLEAAGLSSSALDAARARGDALAARMERDAERAEVEIFAAAADRMREAAAGILAKDHPCTQCGGALPIPAHFFRSVHVPCAYCAAVNTFEPGSRVRAVEHFCAHHLARRAAWDAWGPLEAAEAAHRGAGEPGAAHRKALEDAARRYWTLYFEARAAVVPELGKELEREIEARVKGALR